MSESAERRKLPLKATALKRWTATDMLEKVNRLTVVSCHNAAAEFRNERYGYIIDGAERVKGQRLKLISIGQAQACLHFPFCWQLGYATAEYIYN